MVAFRPIWCTRSKFHIRCQILVSQTRHTNEFFSITYLSLQLRKPHKICNSCVANEQFALCCNHILHMTVRQRTKKCTHPSFWFFVPHYYYRHFTILLWSLLKVWLQYWRVRQGSIYLWCCSQGVCRQKFNVGAKFSNDKMKTRFFEP